MSRECGLWSHLLCSMVVLIDGGGTQFILFLCCGGNVQSNISNMCDDPSKNQDPSHYVFLHYIVVFVHIAQLIYILYCLWRWKSDTEQGSRVQDPTFL